MGSSWLVTGAGGMLGHDLVRVVGAHDAVSLTALTRAELDITDAEAVTGAVAGHDLVINAAAWTAVDAAETAEEAATLVNGAGVANLARACVAHGAVLVHVSTDYVFGGPASVGRPPTPYPEDAGPDPVNAYGRSKLAGELAVARHLPERGYVVRTAGLYGEHGPNFVATMLSLAARRDWVEVVDDQVMQPTWSFALATRLHELGVGALGGTAPPGIYHGTASGQTTWYGLARAVFAAAGLDVARIKPTTTEAFPRPARRPRCSVLGHAGWALAGLKPMDPWDTALVEAVRRPVLAALAGAVRRAS